MVQIIFPASLCLLLSFVVHSQGKNRLEIMGEIAAPLVQKDFGFGLYGEYITGKQRFSKLTFTTGFSKFANRHDNSIQSQSTSMIPLLIGYRWYQYNFFMEPQLGFGALNGTVQQNGDFIRPSVASLFWAITTGYNWKKLAAGVRFQSARGIDSPNAGFWYNHAFHYTSIYLRHPIF